MAVGLDPAVVSLLVAVALGGASGKPPGVVTLLGTGCPGGAGTIPKTTCHLLQVEAPGFAPIDVEVRVTEPDANAPYLGSVVLATGLDGSFFFADVAGGEELIGDLTAMGLRVMDRRWIGGWLGPSPDVKGQSARMAGLLGWLLANEHQGGYFFAVGNSGGGGEIAYALTTWGLAGRFDGVVLASGPPFTRIDYLCPPPDPGWTAQCPALVPKLACGEPQCTAPPGNPLCGLMPLGMSKKELVDTSILHQNAVTDFGSLGVVILIGDLDCSEWVPQGFLFDEAIQSKHTLEVIPETPHQISSTPQGRQAVVGALERFTVSPPRASSAAGPVGVFWTLVEDGEPRGTLRMGGFEK